MKRIVSFAAALAAAPLFAAAPVSADGGKDAEPTSEQDAARCRSLVERHGKSVAVVRYYVKKGAKGEAPDLNVRYSCPACGGSHFSRKLVSAERGIPAEFAGFVVGPDCVLMSDVLIAPEFVDRIEVECAGETIRAVESEASPDRRALFLKTERPFSAAVPLAFAAPEEGKPLSGLSRFYMVHEPGETIAGIQKSRAGSARYHVELGKSLYGRRANTLVVNGDGSAVTVELGGEDEVGAERPTPPGEWPTEPAPARFERIAAVEARVARAVFPVTLYFEVSRRGGGRGRYYYSYRSSGGDTDVRKETSGMLFAGGRVVVPAKLDPGETERLEKIEANLPGGRKAILRFVGSFADTGAFAAEFEGGVPEGLEPFEIFTADRPLDMRDGQFYHVEYKAAGGVLATRASFSRCVRFEVERGNVPVASFTTVAGVNVPGRESGLLILTSDGRLVEFENEARRPGSVYSGDSDSPQGKRLAAVVSGSDFDPENVPRKTVDRDRTPWIGVEVQVAGQDVVNQKKAAAILAEHGVDRPALVTSVAEGSPGAALGIKPGDLMLSVRHADSSKAESIDASEDWDLFVNWEEELSEGGAYILSVVDGVSPWPDAEGGITRDLARFGVGADVVIAWFSDGVRKEGRTKLVAAPVHFQNAPRARNNDLGITVCDMTYEVRKHLKLADDAGGVVVRKVKGGGIANISGICAYEIILQVNGEDVKSAKDFLAKTKGKKELTFTVRRLLTTRMVPVRL